MLLTTASANLLLCRTRSLGIYLFIYLIFSFIFQSDLEFLISLPQLPKCYDYKCAWLQAMVSGCAGSHLESHEDVDSRVAAQFSEDSDDPILFFIFFIDFY